MKLSEFKSKGKKQTEKQEKEKINESTDVKNLYEKYKDMDQNSLMQELLKNVDKQKSDGNFDFEKLRIQINQILPYPTLDQQKYLMTILQQLK